MEVKILADFQNSINAPLKKINNILSIFSLPRFIIINSVKRCVLYCFSIIRGYVQGALRKRQLLDFFAEHFNGKSRKKIGFDFPVLCY